LFVSYILASVIAIPTMFSKAELVTAMPKAGGDYFYISRSMGLVVGIIAGFSSWFSLSLKGAFALIGMAAYAEMIIPVPIKIIAVFICVGFLIINFLGIKGAARWQVVMVLGLFTVLLSFVSIGFGRINIERYVPFAPFGVKSIFAVSGLVFISYGGLTKIASISEEVKNPGRNIPFGMILALCIVGILYAVVTFIITGLLPPEKLYSTLTPISDAAMTFSGVVGATVVAFAALLAFITTANASIMASSRYPMAMSRDKLLPAFFERVNKRFKTPHYSLIFTGIFMVSAILFLELELLVKVASALLILLYVFANVAVVIMRESKLQNYQPKFHSPLYPWVQILGMAGSIFLLLQMGGLILSLCALFLVAGAAWYFIFVGAVVKKEFALIHVIERIIDKELTGGYLSDELKNILRERDNIIEDRFDKVIKESQILDLENSLDMEEFFKKVAKSLSDRMNVKQESIYEKLIKREKESSTVIRPGLAIPHIIVDGEKKFEILLARCKEGIRFPGITKGVNVVFVLVGSKDERNFHLRALAAIAEIAQHPNFDDSWMNARNEDELRDIILLSARKRIDVTRRF